MTTPTKAWRKRFERFDRALGFALGAAVGFAVVFFTAAEAFDASGRELVFAGLAGGFVLGTLVAVFGDRVLEELIRRTS